MKVVSLLILHLFLCQFPYSSLYFYSMKIFWAGIGPKTCVIPNLHIPTPGGLQPVMNPHRHDAAIPVKICPVPCNLTVCTAKMMVCVT